MVRDELQFGHLRDVRAYICYYLNPEIRLNKFEIVFFFFFPS